MAAYYPKNTVHFANVGAPYLPPRNVMVPGQYLLSQDKRYSLVLQEDANLAIYDQTNGATVWIADGTQAYSSTVPLKDMPLHVLMYGGLYLYDPIRRRTWHTRDSTSVAQSERYHLCMQNDGNLVIVDIQAVWSSDTSATFTPAAVNSTVLNPDIQMEVGTPYPAGEYKLYFQGDGNLVVYNRNGQSVWNSETDGKGATKAIMQGDGNFVLYTNDGKAVWSTKTQGNPGAYAQIQENGAFVIVKNIPMWARFGWQPAPVKPPRKVFYPDHSKGPLPLFGGIGWDF
ncbi:putidacin L1 family lectin-like bacteriocin [Pseudomonas sp. CFBP 8758]|uniref:putidacin L1 family lectin-like bacteriocin n=1 Tax=Pseudomonas sp. CFBP 8758 TaxID=2775286 RepID=UPI0017825994|nr:putidacin L1 family lectin-like bacteriocin [Pseudomonas sp. CFBP 8758]MBD8592344.1 putidacin L1 family lectin-like bacteriocin [Pseudomonas sp. CFBP 8758]